MTVRVAVAHDYLTQRGGAERVALKIAAAFPGAPLYTALVAPDGTFPGLDDLDVRTSFLQHVGPLRRHHRLGLPLYPLAFDRLRPDAEVVIASTSGWAHGIGGDGLRVAYCHTPARWLYRPEQLRPGRAARAGMGVAGPPLRRWDRRRARATDRYLANSAATAARIASTYGIEAEVLPPPPGLTAEGPQQAVTGIEPGYALCVARLLPYKHVDLAVTAARLAGRTLVVVGDGPDPGARRALDEASDVHHRPDASDDELRWLYAHASVLVTAAEEDYGLTPVEAASFGVPTVARAAGGHLETVVNGTTGILVPNPTVASLAAALTDVQTTRWDVDAIRAHAAGRGEAAFVARLRTVVDELLA